MEQALPKHQVRDNGINILDSYCIKKKDFKWILEGFKKLLPGHPVWKRSMGSLRREWAVHNFLYMLKIKQEKTKHVFLDYPQPWYEKVGYFVLGLFSLLFIK